MNNLIFKRGKNMGFTKNQREVIEYGKGSLLVEAGPGSGKTTVIVERIKHLINEGVDPSSFLVITFTNKAADNLKYKLRKELSDGEEDSKDIVLKMHISTIHSFCLEYLKLKGIEKTLVDDDASEKKTLLIQKFRKRLGFKGPSTVLDYQISSVLNKFAEYTSFNVDSEELYEKISGLRPVTQEYIDFVNAVDRFPKKLIDDHDKPLKKKKKNNPDSFEDTILYSSSWYNARFLKIIEAYPDYLELLDEYDYVDYDTLQRKALEVMMGDTEIPYKTIFIDEFQDTDPLQFRIFKILREQSDYFTAVGDVDQHIYAFRSSFNDFFDELIRLEHPHSIPLNVNFRSTENIVRLTEEFISPQRKGTSDKNMVNDRSDCNNPNFLIENESSVEEATNICEIIEYLKENNLINDFSDVAVLYRTHGCPTISNLVEIFSQKGIEFSIKGQRNLFKRDEVNAIKALMWYVSRHTYLGYIPAKDELLDLNLSAFCSDYFKTAFCRFDQSTIDYLSGLQESFNNEILLVENEIRARNGVGKVKASHRVKDNEDQETLVEIFGKVQMPVVDLNMIDNLTDREFFNKLELIREEIRSEEPPTILKVFYKLISLSDLYDYELSYEEIANIAILTQTISNYESFISDTNLRGALFFLMNVIGSYDSYQMEGSGVQLMTVHSAKGLEFPVTIIPALEKDIFPMINWDPDREKDYIFPNDTFYTPNECLKYKTIIKEDENGKWGYETLSIEEENNLNLEEEDRILYVAMTRAKDLLILSTVNEVPDQINRIRDFTEDFSFEKLSEVEIASAYEEPDEENELEDELESLEEPVVLNYSKYTKYISCPYKYDLDYNLGFRRFGSSKAANMGSAFHNVMEELNLKLIDGEVVGKEGLAEIIDEHYKPMRGMEKDPREYGEFKDNVENYYYNYSVNRETLESEFDFELFIDNYILNGAIDLIFRDSDGEIKILDYKYAEFNEDHIRGYIKQSYIYASALKRIPEYKDYEVKKAIIHFVKDDYLYEVEIDEDKMATEFERIKKVSQNIRDGIYRKEPEKAEECANCSYRYFCKPKEFAQELYNN